MPELHREGSDTIAEAVKIEDIETMLYKNGCRNAGTIARVVEIEKENILRFGVLIGLVCGLVLGYLIP